jgi:hypothetical protein
MICVPACINIPHPKNFFFLFKKALKNQCKMLLDMIRNGILVLACPRATSHATLNKFNVDQTGY